MKRTRLQKIMAVYERFGADIATVPDAQAQILHRISMGVDEWVADLLSRDPAPKPSEIASGMEQGLRDTPDIIGSVAMEWRATVMKAFHSAVSVEYLEFHAKDMQRLEQVLARKRIRTEAEFYLIRHKVDVLEGHHSSSRSSECAQCHQPPPSHAMGYLSMMSAPIARQPDAQVHQCYLCHQTSAWNDIKGVGWFDHHEFVGLQWRTCKFTDAPRVFRAAQ